MAGWLQSLGRGVLQRVGLYPVFLLYRGYLSEVGWTRSSESREPATSDGEPLPWITYPALRFLEPRLSGSMSVFEYGAGNSTLWWAARVASVESCEHDREWFERTRERLPSNARVTHHALETDGAYSRAAVASGRRYDIIVIDGRDRIHCARNCLPALEDNGVILWDNSEQDEYREGLDLLRARGFRELPFEGLGPVNPYVWRTSIFYRDDNCLGL